MELDLSMFTSNLSAFFTLLACSITFVSILIRWSKKKKPGATPPVPKGSLPIIGHLRLLGGPELPHKVLSKLADEYGPVYQIKLGFRQVIVVNNSETAKDCLLVYDKDFINIPDMLVYKYLMYDGAAFAVTPYGPLWRELRKISTHELLSNKGLAAVEHIWVSSIRSEVRGLYDKWALENRTMTKDVSIEMRDWIADLSLNSIVELVVGKSIFKKEDGARCMNILKQLFHLAGIITMADAVPLLRWFDIGGYEKQMKKAGIEMDVLFTEWLVSHRRQREMNGGQKGPSWMDTLIDVFAAEDDKKFKFDKDTLIKATSLTMILGGADTVYVTVAWALCLILNHPETLKKVREEIDTHVGKDRRLEKSDINNLVYLHAVIKETLRINPPGPLLVPRESMADTIVGGYHVPAGTMLFINAHKIQRDPLMWDDPTVFRPERFLTTHKHIEPKGHHYELIPFSSGRRICTGTSYALQVMPFMLASLFHSFEITTASGKPIDMSEKHGLTVTKANPVDLILTPRLPHHLYEIDH